MFQVKFLLFIALVIAIHGARAYLSPCQSDCVDLRVLCYERCDALGKSQEPKDVLEKCAKECDYRIEKGCQIYCKADKTIDPTSDEVDM